MVDAYKTDEAKEMAKEIAADRASRKPVTRKPRPAPAMNPGEALTKAEQGSIDVTNPDSDFYRDRRAAEAASKEAEKYIK